MQDVVDRLRGVVDPELGADVVSLGMVAEVAVSDGEVVVPVRLTTSACPLRSQLRDDVVRLVSTLPGVRRVRVTFTELDAEGRSLLMARARRNAQSSAPATSVPATARVLAVVSGTRGTGKSSVSAHLAAALAHQGFRTGLLDGGVAGHCVPSLPATQGRLGTRHAGSRDMVAPHELAHGRGTLAVVPTALVVDEPGTALLWPGPVLSRVLEHFLCDVDWTGTDYLVVDLPPGTGDVHMALARLVPHADVLVVTTPDPAAAEVAALAADMARRCSVRVAGVVENMAPVCRRHDEVPLPGEPRGEEFARHVGAPLLATVPLDRSQGAPGAALLAGPHDVFAELARKVVEEVAPPVDLGPCTSRLLRALEDAAAAADPAPGGAR